MDEEEIKDNKLILENNIIEDKKKLSSIQNDDNINPFIKNESICQKDEEIDPDFSSNEVKLGNKPNFNINIGLFQNNNIIKKDFINENTIIGDVKSNNYCYQTIYYAGKKFNINYSSENAKKYNNIYYYWKIIEQQKEVMNIVVVITKLGYLYVKQKSYIKKIQKIII